MEIEGRRINGEIEEVGMKKSEIEGRVGGFWIGDDGDEEGENFVEIYGILKIEDEYDEI